MPQKETVRVKGYTDFVRACDRAGKETKTEVRGTFRKVGDIVKEDWAGRYRSSDSKSAAGLRTVVRQRGVSVEQSLRKTTGQHSEWGGWQARRGGDALEAKEPAVEQELEHAIDRVADHFDQKGI